MNNSKKGILLVSMLVLVLFAAYQIKYVDTDRMEVQVVSDKKVNKLMESLKNLTEGEADVKLFFNGESLPYDAGSHTFFLPLSMSDSFYEAGNFQAELEGQEAEVFFFEDFTEKEKSEWMKENARIPFLAVSLESYVNLNLTLTGTSLIDFKSTEFMTENNLPIFEMTVYDARSKKDWVKKCYTTSTIRGNTSLSYDKKSLRLKLKKQKDDGSFVKTNKNLLGLRDDDDWILNSLYADDSKIKDKLAYELWNEAGANSNPYNKTLGTQFEHVEVFMNYGYAGLYGLCYPIDGKQTGVTAVSKQIKAEKPVIERLYKKKYTGVWNADDFVGALPDANMPNYRGGFYLKGDTILQDESEWKPLYDLAQCIEASDEAFSAQITELVNQRNVLENWLFYQAIGGFDNYAKNYYYMVKNKGGHPYGYFIPWDLNIAFGDVYADNQYYAAFDETVVSDVIPWEPAQRMIELNVDDSRTLLAETWKRWRNDIFDTEKVLKRMDELHVELKNSGAYEREQNRWPNGRYTEDISNMKSFTAERLEFVDNYIANPYNVEK